MTPGSPSPGASTAIYGLLGALGVLMLARRQDLRGLLTLLAINVFISFLPGVSLLGHLGGLVAGRADGRRSWCSPGAGRRADRRAGGRFGGPAARRGADRARRVAVLNL